jgi:CheY-like chemotaxis protein
MNPSAIALDDKELLAAALHAQLLARRRGTFEHDLKNIMHGLLSGADLLDKALGMRSQRIAPTECLKLLQQQLGRTQATLNRILEEIAPAAAAAQTDLSLLLEECAHDLRHELQRLELATEIESGLSVLAPRARLKDVLLAVMFDAVDRCPKRGQLRLRATREGERAHVRLSHLRASDDGSTLLRTAATVARALGIEVHVAEIDGERQTELRLAIAPQCGETAPKLLIVDANRDAADSLALLVQLAGFRALAAYDTATARQQAREWHPDAILVDADGSIDVGSFVRGLAQHQESSARVIGLSQASSSDMTAMALPLLRKPLDPAALRELLNVR